MVEIPQGTYARIATRSGLTHKPCIAIGECVIDAGSTEEVKVIINNDGNKDYQVQEGGQDCKEDHQKNRNVSSDECRQPTNTGP